MESRLQVLKLYLTEKGHCPFEEWISSLRDIQGRAKVRVCLDRLGLGNFNNCRSLGGGLFELKINFGPGYRVYFGQSGKNLIILLCGGHKSSQPEDITKARNYWLEFRSR